MTVTDAVLLVLALLAIVCAVCAGYVQWREATTAVRRRVVVNLKDGTAISGVLWQRRGKFLVLRDASHIVDSRGPQKMDGEAIVDADAVAFVQAFA